ncbi:hypothetical protein KKC59_02385 [bacterium]|nr:hypothetical protein [bacterium]
MEELKGKGKGLTGVHRSIKFIAELGIDKASQILSKMLKHGSKIELSNINVYDVTDFSKAMFKKNTEIVGAMIDLQGDAPFKFLFWVGLDESLKLTDLFLHRPVGTSKKFDEYVESCVQEVGNILSSAISSVFSRDFSIAMKPEVPCVFKDFSGSVFEEAVRDLAEETNDIMIIETRFFVVQHEILCSMFIMPKQGSVEIIDFLTGAV